MYQRGSWRKESRTLNRLSKGTNENIENLQVTNEKKQFVQQKEFGTAPENMSCHSKKRYSFKGFFFVLVRGIFKRSHLFQSFFQWFVFIDDLNLQTFEGWYNSSWWGYEKYSTDFVIKNAKRGTKRLVKGEKCVVWPKIGHSIYILIKINIKLNCCFLPNQNDPKAICEVPSCCFIDGSPPPIEES